MTPDALALLGRLHAIHLGHHPIRTINGGPRWGGPHYIDAVHLWSDWDKPAHARAGAAIAELVHLGHVEHRSNGVLHLLGPMP